MLDVLGVIWQAVADFYGQNKAVLNWIGGGLATALVFLAPRIWDLFKKRLEHWVERSPLERDVPEPNDRQQLDAFCDALRLHLDDLDKQSRWEHSRYVPLDAEVNVLRGERKRRHVLDLFAGIKAYRRARLFLVIGDPGSGKSVALRKLARELLAKAVRAGRIPIYVNLREWSPAERWNTENPPSEEQFRRYLLQTVKDRVSIAFHGFLDQWLLKLLDRGRLFLIFDSFDEIPAVMDAEEPSSLIRQLSEVIALTARGGGGGRAVLASRPFRRPRFGEDDRGRHPRLRRDVPVFELRPFSDVKIAAAIERAAKDAERPLRNPEAIKRALFRERPDLASIARTPFMLGLMIDFWEARPGTMPASQADLFQSFVSRSLRRAEATVREGGLDDDAVLACATAIAENMFESDRHGLDMPVATLAEQLPNLPVVDAVAVLRRARIARPSESASFSFIHRRFHEYFLIDHFRRHPDSLPYTSIPEDTRWREALVLFCEVADAPVAREIAEFCWTQVRGARDAAAEMGGDAYRHALHSLRFLANAFRARRDLIAGFEPALAERIETDVRGQDMLIAKHALEASGVLSDASAERTIAAALSSGNTWLMDTAFRACRYLPAPSWKTRLLVMDRLLSIPPVEHLKTYREIMFSLHAIEGMEVAVWFCRLRHWDVVLFVIAMFCFILLLPFSVPLIVVFSFFAIILSWRISLSEDRRNLRAKTYRMGPKKENKFSRVRAKLFGNANKMDSRSTPPNNGLEFFYVFGLSAAIFSLIVIYNIAFFESKFNQIPEGLLLFLFILIQKYWIILFAWIGESAIFYVKVFIIIVCVLLFHPFEFVCKFTKIFLRIYAIYIDGNKKEFIFACLYVILIPVAFIAVLFLVSLGMMQIITIFIEVAQTSNVILLYLIPVILLILLCSLIGYLFLNLVRDLYFEIQQQRAFKRATQMNPTRAQIHTCFLGLKTERYRQKYVRWLEANCEEAPNDVWPERRPPNINNDAASIALAKLEERWLGLDQ